MSIRFNGTTQLINLGSNPYFRNVSQATLMAWVKPRTLPANNIQAVVVGISIGPPPGISGSSRASLEIRGNATAPADLACTARRLDTDAGSGLNTGAITGANPGVWWHLAVGLDYTTTPGITAFWFFNGVLVATITGGTTGGGNTSDTDCKSATIGADEGLAAGFLDGDVEDVRIYNRQVGANEIATIYAAQGADGIVSGLAGRYGCNELGESQTVVSVPSIAEFSRTVGSPVASPTYAPSIIRGTRTKIVRPVGSRLG